MLKKVFSISFSFIALSLIWIINTAKSESIENYYNLDTDFNEIGTIIEDYELIFLGEVTHWSRDIIKEKIRLIEYLIENHGYDTLFIESSFPSYNYYKNSDSKINSEVFSDELFDDLFNNPDVTIQAIDISPDFDGNTTSVPRYEEEIYNELVEYDIELAEDFKRSEYALRNWFAEGLIHERDAGTYEREDIYTDIMNQDFYEQLSSPARTYIEEKQFTVENYIKRIDFNTGNYYDVRAEGMADSIERQLEDGQKAIVWAANGHLFYDPTNIQYDHEVFTRSKEIHRTTTMTKILKEKNYNIYNTALFLNQGVDFSLMPADFSLNRTDDPNVLEGYIGNKVDYNVFIDLKNSDWFNNEEFVTTRLGLDFRIIPEEQMDGLIYIDYVQE